MPVDELRKKIYLFIRDRNYAGRKVYWNPHIKLYVKANNYSLQEGGYALQQLREKRAVSFTKKYGWVAA